MLEKLADYDDELMEQLLEDMQPPRDKVFADLVQELRDGADLPGADRLGRERQRHPAAAEGAAPRSAVRRQHGQAPGSRRGRLGAQVLKTFHTAHGGKLSVVRVLAGEFADGTDGLWRRGRRSASPASSPCSARSRPSAARRRRATRSAFGRLEGITTGETLSAEQGHGGTDRSAAHRRPVFGLAIAARENARTR